MDIDRTSTEAFPEAWEIVIGLEIHAQILSASKLFSPSSATFGGEPNRQVSLVDAAMPGMLPVLNAFCVDQAIRAGLALGANINRRSLFARKNYFYPDLPQGYQISQYTQPIVGEGVVEVEEEGGASFQVRILRAHLEQDAGKLLHDQIPHVSLVDLNRTGVALLEIVSHPDLRSALQASAYLQHVRATLQWIGVCDGNMQEGSLRADVNISIRPRGQKTLGTRTEIKNLNSLRFMRQAIMVEAWRQLEVLERGESVVQQTRLYDPTRNETRPLRNKENAQDYRYFSEPDLPPLVLSNDHIEQIRLTLPELPQIRARRFERDWEVRRADALLLTTDRAIADAFETSVRAVDVKHAPIIASWWVTEVFAELTRRQMTIAELRLVPEELGRLVAMVGDRVITARVGKEALAAMMTQHRSLEEVTKSMNLDNGLDAAAIVEAVREVLAQNPDQVAQYRAGKESLWGWLVGQVMRRTKGRAQPDDIHRVLKAALHDSHNTSSST